MNSQHELHTIVPEQHITANSKILSLPERSKKTRNKLKIAIFNTRRDVSGQPHDFLHENAYFVAADAKTHDLRLRMFIP